MNYLSQINSRVTPQSEAIPGTVPNSAGGYSFAVTPWQRFERFLILGSEGGSYYASERDLTKQNYDVLRTCIAEDGARAVRLIVSVSDSGRAPKNDPALFALAVAASAENPATRSLALSALPNVARIGTHLFHFLTYVQNFRGWGRSLRDAVGSWYLDRSHTSLATQLLKYQSRDGWSHRDVLRLTHVAPRTPVQNALFQYVVKGELPTVTETLATDMYRAYEFAGASVRLLHTTDEKEAVKLIQDFKLPREVVPTQLLNSPAVWEALLPHMGITALIRNLGKLSNVGLLMPLSETARFVSAKVQDADVLREGRVHPIQLLMARLTYGKGAGVRGSLSWTPVAPVVDALDNGFYAAFSTITPSNKRFLLGVDVSGSMRTGMVAGVNGFTPRMAAACMAMVTARTEPQYDIMGFAHSFVPLGIAASESLESVLRKMDAMPFGGTDCALPMLYAMQRKLAVDTFVVYTDSETWFGKVHPVQALRQYRDSTGIPARLIVVGMLSNGFTIADPTDSGMLDVVGFDSAAPQVISNFAAGAI